MNSFFFVVNFLSVLKNDTVLNRQSASQSFFVFFIFIIVIDFMRNCARTLLLLANMEAGLLVQCNMRSGRGCID